MQAAQHARGRARGGARRHGLSAAEWRAWERDGFFLRRRVFAPGEVARLCEAAEQVVARADAALCGAERYEIDGNGYAEARIAGRAATVQLEHGAPGRLGAIRVIEPFHALHPVFEALVDDARLVEPMRDLVGGPVALFTDKLNLKRPRVGSRFGWHQDSPYWMHFCNHLDQLPNVLLALDAAAPHNGCLRLVRGSHRRGPLPGRSGEGVLGPLFTHPAHFDESAAEAIVLPAGGAVFFSPHSVHGSQPNASGDSRRALVLTYQPAGLRMFKVDRVRNTGVGNVEVGAAAGGAQSSDLAACSKAARSSA
ncbi:MAG: phytanoyl-CoA dioxygenase family protein [Deltaproteobacteria bacterium]|nr:phytanoyl-CoA dioxygenase family protein [Deltaproteobacteria bacterium]